MYEYNTLKMLLSDIKKAKAVYGYVAYNQHDGTYIQLVKSDIVEQFKTSPRDTQVKYSFDGYCLFIN